MSPVTIYSWFGYVNGDVVQFKVSIGNYKVSIFSKMFLVSNVFINYLWLNILDLIVLVNAYIV